jgi:hypothetical protein
MEFIIGVVIALTIIGVFATLNVKAKKKEYEKEEKLKNQRLETLIAQENARLEKESKFEKNIQYKKDEAKPATVSTHGGLGNKTTTTFGASNPKSQTRKPQPRQQPRPSQSRSTSSSSSYSGYYDADYDNRNNSNDYSSNNDSYDSGSDSCGSGGSDD